MATLTHDNCYRVLRIPINAPFDMVKKAYRQYVHLYHPDVSSRNQKNSERFKEIQEAYQILRELSLRSDLIIKEHYVQAFLDQSFEPTVLVSETPNLTASVTHKYRFLGFFNSKKGKARYIDIEVDIVTRNLPTKALIDRLVSSDNKFVKMAAAKSLFPRKNARNLLYLLTAINDKDLDVSDFMITLLRNYFDYEGLTYLKKIWEISSQAQKFKLILILEKIADPRVTSIISEMEVTHSSFLGKKLKRFFARFGRSTFTIFN